METTYRQDQIATARPWYDRISAGSIFAGFLVGFLTYILLSLLGWAIGLSGFNPQRQASLTGIGAWTIVWACITLFLSAGVAGAVAAYYGAARERGRGVIYGLAAAGFLSLAVVWLVGGVIIQLVTSTIQMVGGAAAAGAEILQQQGQGLQQQLQQGQQALPSQQELLTAAGQATDTAAGVFWFSFLILALAAIGGALGGLLGARSYQRHAGIVPHRERHVIRGEEPMHPIPPTPHPTTP